jgi:hypothetical protein
MAAPRTAILFCVCAAATSAPYLNGFASSDDLSLLQDPDGWEYVRIVTNSGFPTEHPCFDGVPHTQCRGTLTLGSNGRFAKTIYINGQSDNRAGRYTVNGHELTFFDEYDTQDGPYKITLNREQKTLVLELGNERMDLMLEKEYRDRAKSQKKDNGPKR